jgi:phosphohistidine phosphatase
MKRLLIIRHAKSDRENSYIKDFDRPLNQRGKRDAPYMAQQLLKRGIKIDAFVSSPAVRALETCKYFVQAFEENVESIITIPSMYLASDADFLRTVSSLKAQYTTVALFGHNSGLTDFVNRLTTVRVDNVPTCGIYALEINIDHWKDFKNGEKKFWFFDYPKLHL